MERKRKNRFILSIEGDRGICIQPMEICKEIVNEYYIMAIISKVIGQKLVLSRVIDLDCYELLQW